MSYASQSPRVVRGALVVLDAFNPAGSAILFQYNPDTVTRTLEPHIGAGSAGARAEVLRLSGPPTEKIDMDIEIDATDQLQRGDAQTSSAGIYPQLAALEVLLYPKSAMVMANSKALQLGTIEVIPPEAPLTLLVWGSRRIVPVKLASFKITEEAHDAQLNPLRAKVTLQLQVLSYNELPAAHPGYGVFLAHHIVKETMALAGSIAGAAQLGPVP